MKHQLVKTKKKTLNVYQITKTYRAILLMNAKKIVIVHKVVVICHPMIKNYKICFKAIQNVAQL